MLLFARYLFPSVWICERSRTPQGPCMPLINLEYRSRKITQEVMKELFIREVFPWMKSHGLRYLVHDNCLGFNKAAFQQWTSTCPALYGITFVQTPASSPDLNLVELYWGAAQNILATVYRPQDQAELELVLPQVWQDCMAPIKRAQLRNFLLKNMWLCLSSVGSNKY